MKNNDHKKQTVVDEKASRSNELHVANEMSKATDEKFRLLVESVKDYGIFLMDTEGNIQSWNEGAKRIKGYTAKEILGKNFSVFYTPEDIARQHPQYELREAIKHDRYEEEGWRVRKNGTRFWANIVITALRNDEGNLVGFAKVTRDLTERKQSEEKLRISEERARKIFEGIKDYAVITLNTDGTVASWNEGARQIKGYEPQEIIGKYFSIFYTEDDRSMGKCEYELKEAVETGRFEDEGWRIRKDGTKFWASVSITPIYDNSGKLIGFTKVTRDMTDKKRADDLLKMSYANLEKRIAERTGELTAINKKLQDAIQIRDEFLSIASHELRTPLTPLKLQIQSLMSIVKKNSLDHVSVDRLLKMANTCDKAITRLSNLIDNLLDVSRINMGKLILDLEKTDLVIMAQEIIERYKSQIIDSGSEVTLQTSEPVVGSFDRLRIEQVFINLLTNSLKYGLNKPITITVGIEKGLAFVKFKDQGIGIVDADLERIFKRFERVNSRENVSGLGLGLYITKQIVEAHKGTIEVKSSYGEGSTFTVKLPLS